ncbi:hypothetical protein Btru_041122 [Bulinus truncatus]|nr:hypothetical protein Btru_041122 [Bulinus truncatus]
MTDYYSTYLRSTKDQSSSYIDAGITSTATAAQPSVVYAHGFNISCIPTAFVRCDTYVADVSTTNKYFGVSLQRKPHWLDERIFFNFSKCHHSKCFYQGEHINESTRMVIVEIKRLNDSFQPARRWPHQLYVAAVWESPVYTLLTEYLNDTNSYWNTRFNLTASYRTDSDIFVPYGVLDFRPKRIGARPNYYQIARNKSKWVLWYVSNCGAPSLRDIYIKEMQRVIDVDIYGDCGQPCPKRGFECSEPFYAKYRYYLSFENSLCKDYLTEKFLKLFKREFHIVPVVRGGFNYEKYLPGHTFINSAHFTNATHLARFLKRLGEDHLAYSKYLEHKDQYRRLERSGVESLGCQVCRYLHTMTLKGTIADLKQWLLEGRCQEPRDI